MGDETPAERRRAVAEGVLLALLSNPSKDYDFDGAAHDAVKYTDALIAELARTEPRS